MTLLAEEPCYSWSLDGPPVGGQTTAFTSFAGVHPALPPDVQLPICGLCHARQTFFFQLAFPAPHSWARRTLAVFACTDCADEAHLIPPMLDGPLARAVVPESFLAAAAVNYRLLVFATSEARLRDDYVPRVTFNSIVLRSAPADVRAHKIGGVPTWLMEDETPASFAGREPMAFLFQTMPGLRFPLVAEAPSQWTIGLDGRPVETGLPYYELFIRNALYGFAPRGGVEPSPVYLLTQVP